MCDLCNLRFVLVRKLSPLSILCILGFISVKLAWVATFAWNATICIYGVLQSDKLSLTCVVQVRNQYNSNIQEILETLHIK